MFYCGRRAIVETIDVQRGKVIKNDPYDILIDGRCVRLSSKQNNFVSIGVSHVPHRVGVSVAFSALALFMFVLFMNREFFFR